MFGPVLPDSGQEFPLVLLHEPDERRISGIFVRGGPEDHFREDRGKIDAFRCKRADPLSPIRWIALGGDDSMSLQPPQTIRQDVRGNTFVGTEEFLVGPEAAEHHVADDE